jgi:hypothetical protein
LEVNNADPIVGDVSLPTSREIKKRAKDFFATQSRAVTKTDYVAYIYNMPEKFGTIKRANIIPDSDSFKRNLNLYVVSESSDGSLAVSNSLIKQNLKTWLNKNKMVHDTIDILDAKIINLGIDYVLLADDRANKFDLVKGVTSALRTELLAVLPDIGEAFDISTVYSIINSVPGVVDAVDVEVVLKRGTSYSDLYYDIPANLSPDGRLVTFPEDYIWEIKFPFSDIRGSVQ